MFFNLLSSAYPDKSDKVKIMKCLFLINPVAGGGSGKAVAAAIEKRFHASDLNIQVVFTNPNKLQQQVHSLASGIDLLIIGGGDGTVSHVANALGTLQYPPPFSIIPIGTGNDMARALGWYTVWKRGKITSFMSAIKSGEVKGLDLWTLGRSNTFLAYAGLGIDAEIVKSFTRWRNKAAMSHLCGTAANRLLYIALGFRHLLVSSFRKPGITINIKADMNEKTREIRLPDSAGIIFGNIMYYAGGGRLSHESQFDDGLLEVYILKSCTDFLSLLVKGRFPGTKGPKTTLRLASMEIISDIDVPGQADGEWVGEIPAKNRVRIERIRSLPVLIPTGHSHITAENEFGDNDPMDLETKGTPLPGPATFNK